MSPSTPTFSFKNEIIPRPSPLDRLLSGILIASAVDPSQVVDLTGYVEKGEMLGNGSYGDVHRGHWTSRATVQGVADQLPDIAIKVMRAVFLKDKKDREKRYKARTYSKFLLLLFA